MLNKQHYAVVVGIGTYPGGFPSLNGPVNDARAFATWLWDPDGGALPKENVQLILTPDRKRPMTLDSAVPDKTRIDDALLKLTHTARDRLDRLPEEERETARRNTRLYIFVAGHGILPGSGQAALLTAKAQSGWHDNLELRSYQDWFERDGTFGELCVFADCCRSYEALTTPGVPPFRVPSQIGGTVVSLLGWATSAGKLAFEESDETLPPEQRRGYFSSALVEGLRSAVDPRAHGVTSRSLSEYIATRVALATASRPVHQRQSADIHGHMTADITFGPIGRRPRRADLHRVTIRFPPSWTEPVELISADEMARYWDPADGVWTVRLVDGLYAVRRAGSDFDGTGLAADGAFAVTGRDLDVQL